MILAMILGATITMQQATVQPKADPTVKVSPQIAETYKSGVESFKIVVAPDGKIASCSANIEGQGPIPDLDNCKEISRFKATPAQDQNGEKIFGTASFLMSWSRVRSGATSGPPLAPPQLKADLTLPISRLPDGLRSDSTTYLILVAGSDGKVEACSIKKTSGVPALDAAACRAVLAASVTPTKDANGAPVRAVQSLTIDFAVSP